MAALDFMKQQGQNNERKRQARADIYASSANSLGAPTYNVKAAGVNRQNRLANQNAAFDASSRLADYLASAPKTGDTAGAKPTGPTMNGPASGQPSTSGAWTGYPEHLQPGYAGSQMGGTDEDEDDALASIGIY